MRHGSYYSYRHCTEGENGRACRECKDWHAAQNKRQRAAKRQRRESVDQPVFRTPATAKETKAVIPRTPVLVSPSRETDSPVTKAASNFVPTSEPITRTRPLNKTTGPRLCPTCNGIKIAEIPPSGWLGSVCYCR